MGANPLPPPGPGQSVCWVKKSFICRHSCSKRLSLQSNIEVYTMEWKYNYRILSFQRTFFQPPSLPSILFSTISITVLMYYIQHISVNLSCVTLSQIIMNYTSSILIIRTGQGRSQSLFDACSPNVLTKGLQGLVLLVGPGHTPVQIL